MNIVNIYKPFLLSSLSFPTHLAETHPQTPQLCMCVCVRVIKNVSTMSALVGTISRVSGLNNWSTLLLHVTQHSVHLSAKGHSA